MDTTEQVITITPKLSFWELITAADIVGQLVMLLLTIVSIISWAIIINKYYSYKHIKAKILAFESLFWSGQVLDMLYERTRQSIDNPMAAVFVAAMNECKRQEITNRASGIIVGLKERIMQSMYLVRNRETEKLEQNLGFLETVGSSATFVGVFGTVCSIMHSFQSIAASNNTSLAVVAPGIAQALLATAIGLVAAIPATVGYNMLAAKLNGISNKLEDFSYELYTLLSRAIDEEKL